MKSPRQEIPPGTIGFDIDGVVADTMEAFIRMARDDYGKAIRPDEITDFMVEQCLDLDPRVIEEIFSRLMDDPVGEKMLPMEGAVATIRDLAELGPVTFITARPRFSPIADWLRLHLGDETFKRCRLVTSGDHDNKAEYIRAHGLRFFIDDRARTCRDLAAVPDITPIVYEQPWNHKRHRLLSVKDWRAIREMCAI